jgi:hypothetical protein
MKVGELKARLAKASDDAEVHICVGAVDELRSVDMDDLDNPDGVVVLCSDAGPARESGGER